MTKEKVWVCNFRNFLLQNIEQKQLLSQRWKEKCFAWLFTHRPRPENSSSCRWRDHTDRRSTNKMNTHLQLAKLLTWPNIEYQNLEAKLGQGLKICGVNLDFFSRFFLEMFSLQIRRPFYSSVNTIEWSQHFQKYFFVDEGLWKIGKCLQFGGGFSPF